MALNDRIYFQNPVKGKAIGATYGSSAGPITLLTVAASGETKKVKSFAITMSASGIAADHTVLLSIGTAKITASIASPGGSAGTSVLKLVTSTELGLNDIFLQPSDLITVTTLVNTGGGAACTISIALIVEDYEL